jgi:hypothetical protein
MNVFTLFAQSNSGYTRVYTEAEAKMILENFFIIAFPFIILGLLISYIVGGVLLGQIFKKAGLRQWPAWVPFYNSWKLFQLGGQHGALSLLLLIPFIQIIGVIFQYIAYYQIGLKFGKEKLFVLIGIFIPLLWLVWLALDSSKWNDKRGTAPSLANGPYRSAETSEVI